MAERDPFEKWLRSHYQLAPLTARNYAILGNAFERDYGEPTYENVCQFLFARPKKRRKEIPTEQNRTFQKRYAMEKYLVYCGQPELLEKLRPTMRSIRPARPRRIKDIPDFGRFREYLGLLDPELRALLMCQYDTGARIGPFLKLRRGDVHPLKDGTAYLELHEKGGKIANRYIEAVTQKELSALIKDMPPDALVFKQGRARGMTGRRPYYTFYFALKNSSRKFKLNLAAYGISTHYTRAARAKQVYRDTKDILKVKNLLNHDNLNVTLRYIETGKDVSKELIDSEDKW